jgi:hypothetical protein
VTWDLDTWKITQAILDLRYDFAFSLWDRAGAFWNAASDQWDELSIQEAAPNKTNAALGNRFTISVMTERANITNYLPTQPLDGFIDKTATFTDLLEGHLDVEVYNRIGFRIKYFKPFDEMEAATEQLLQAEVIHVPEGPHFGIDGPPSKANYVTRIEGESHGATVRLHTFNQAVDFGVGPKAQWTDLKASRQTRKGIVFDVDYYTTKPSEVEQVGVQPWLEDAHRLIRRDAGAFLNTHLE